MPLISCPECGRQISTAAEACPQCGHPNRPESKPCIGPRCYKCSTAATTRCVSCGAMSCPLHVDSIYVTHGRGGAYELRCESCYSSAQVFRVFGWVVGAIVLAVIFFVVMNMRR